MRHYSRVIALIAPVLFAPILHAQDRPLDWDFTEVWRVGGLDAPEWAHFTRRDDMAFDGDGNLYAVDGEAGHILKLDASGRLVMTIGRPGEGPGEFEALYGAVVWRDGSLAANDGGRDVFHLFGADGAFQRMVRWSATTGLTDTNVTRNMRPGPRSGVIYAQGKDAGLRAVFAAMEALAGNEDSEKMVDERTIEALSLAGDLVISEVVLEAWRPTRPELTEVDLSDTDALMSVLNRAPHFEPELRWDVTPGGAIAYVDSSVYEIRIVQGGSTVNTLTRAIAPLPVTRALASDIRDRMIRELEAREPRAIPGPLPQGVDPADIQRRSREAARRQIEDMEFYPEVPVVARVRAAWDGSVWVERRDPLDEDANGAVDVFGPDGAYQGTLAAGGLGVPDAFGPHGLVAYWRLDEMDVPSIVVYRLPARLGSAYPSPASQRASWLPAHQATAPPLHRIPRQSLLSGSPSEAAAR